MTTSLSEVKSNRYRYSQKEEIRIRKMKKIIQYSLLGSCVAILFYVAMAIFVNKNLSDNRNSLSSFFSIIMIQIFSILTIYFTDRYVVPLNEKQKYKLMRISFFCILFFYGTSLIFRELFVKIILQ